MKLRQDNILISICQEFCPQGVSASVHARIHPSGRHLLSWQTPSSGQTPPADTTPGQTTPWSYTPCPVHAGIYMATAADGMHPNGMHSC